CSAALRPEHAALGALALGPPTAARPSCRTRRLSCDVTRTVRRPLAFLVVVAAAGVIVGAQSRRSSAAGGPPRFSVVEASISVLRTAMAEKRVTSREIVNEYLMRIAVNEDRLHAALSVNPHALEEAEALDRERRAGHVRGPLHGIPIALKDNIQTTELPTTGGTLAFDGFVPPYEATITRNLRAAGAI